MYCCGQPGRDRARLSTCPSGLAVPGRPVLGLLERHGSRTAHLVVLHTQDDHALHVARMGFDERPVLFGHADRRPGDGRCRAAIAEPLGQPRRGHAMLIGVQGDAELRRPQHRLAPIVVEDEQDDAVPRVEVAPDPADMERRDWRHPHQAKTLDHADERLGALHHEDRCGQADLGDTSVS